MWSIIAYIFHPRIIFSHLIGSSLLFGLHYQGIEIKTTLFLAIIEEITAVLLYLLIPNSFATIITLAVCINLYEKVLGPRVQLSPNAILVSDDDLSPVLSSAGSDVEYTALEQDGRYILSTPLQFVVYSASKWGRQNDEIQVIELDEVSSVEAGCDYNIIRAVRNGGGESQQCFHFIMGTGDTTVTFLCPQKTIRDQWMETLKKLQGKRIADLRAAWLDKIFKEADIGITDGKITFDEAVDILNRAKRKTDKPYIKEIFNTFAKIANVKTENGDVALDKVQFEKFFDVAAKRPEIHQVYERLLDKSTNEKVLNPSRFQKFIENDQKEKQSLQIVKTWIRQFETILPSYNLTSVGFTNFILDPDHSIINHSHSVVYQDMKQPLCHYFIATSHNTYLTKDQLKGKSSVDAYINAFKRGCKCVELDCWDGPNNEPIIYHGHTLTSKIKFKDVIQAVKDYAFCVSQYPVILSFENHCSVDQQIVMAKHLTEILGDMMYTKEPPEKETMLPSPEKLKGFVIIKNKKLKAGVDETEEGDDEFSDTEVDEKDVEELDEEDDDEDAMMGKNARKALKGILNQTRKLSARIPGGYGGTAPPEKEEKPKKKKVPTATLR